MSTTTLERPAQTGNRVVQIAYWKGRDPVQDTVAEWPDEAMAAQNWGTHDDTRAMVILSALQYPAWKRVWDNPEDSVYDQFLAEL